MDFVGVCSVAFIVAFGGGTLRDVLLDRRPLFWIQHEHHAWTVFGLALVGAMLPRLPDRLARWLNLPDAIGLGLFSIVGARIALELGHTPFIASIFGVVTGTCGGVIADIACNEVPTLFRKTTPLYATCAFAGCWVFLLARARLGDDPAKLAGAAIVVALRLAALRWNLTIPAPRT
jgi:uncharacterized membrane protein YeiH